MMNPYTQSLPERLAVWRARCGKRAHCPLAAALIVAVALVGGKDWQQRQTARGALLYEQLQQTLSSEPASSVDKKETRIARIATELENRFGRTPYAQMGALAAAKALYQAANAQAAKVQLQWAADVAIDVEYRQIA